MAFDVIFLCLGWTGMALFQQYVQDLISGLGRSLTKIVILVLNGNASLDYF